VDTFDIRFCGRAGGVVKNHVYYSNCAACFFGLKKWSESADDAQMCIELKPTFIKGYIHLAKAS
jgi:hypothetical protein